jgi:hypothetical protein
LRYSTFQRCGGDRACQRIRQQNHSAAARATATVATCVGVATTATTTTSGCGSICYRSSVTYTSWRTTTRSTATCCDTTIGSTATTAGKKHRTAYYLANT